MIWAVLALALVTFGALGCTERAGAEEMPSHWLVTGVMGPRVGAVKESQRLGWAVDSKATGEECEVERAKYQREMDAKHGVGAILYYCVIDTPRMRREWEARPR